MLGEALSNRRDGEDGLRFLPLAFGVLGVAFGLLPWPPFAELRVGLEGLRFPPFVFAFSPLATGRGGNRVKHVRQEVLPKPDQQPQDLHCLHESLGPLHVLPSPP